MKVLVFDDSLQHRKVAELVLKDHDVTIVGTYDEAQAALVPVVDHKKIREELKKLFGDFSPWRAETEEEKQKAVEYKVAQERITKECTTYPDFDAVLTDLLVPASKQAQGPDGGRFVGQEMPLGSIIALLAIFNGIKKVALVTDMNHHNHPASAALDCFRGVGCGGEIQLLCTNWTGIAYFDEQTLEPVDEKFLDTEAGKRKYGDYSNCHGLISGKNWLAALEQLNK